MDILRAIDVQVIDSSNIDVLFSSTLTPGLITSNVSIISDTSNVPDAEVLEIIVSKNKLSIKCQPLTPFAFYFLQFQSVGTFIFESINGNARILENGIYNRQSISGPLSAENPVQNYFKSYFNDNIYNLDDTNTVISKYIQSLSVILSKALYDIKQLKNENYLSFTITDEVKVRGGGPFDRLNEEGAYEIMRLGRGPTNALTAASLTFTDFPFYPITLQRQVVQEVLTANSINDIGFFNINSLIFNLGNSPITKVNSVVFTFNSANPVYVYDIETMGYQIKNNKYDQEFGFSYQQLEENQFIISDKVLDDPTFELDKILKIDVTYEYKNLGIIINPDSVSVNTILDASREVLPPIINVFSLQHAPIVNGSGEVPTLGGVVFTDPNSNTGASHPAFTKEIPFRLSALPSSPGQYAIDYSVGQVYVYGNDLNNNGTGPFPPLATYKYLFTYNNEQDYVYDSDFHDLVALPFGNLIEGVGTINFNYEQVFIPGIDYKSSLHKEELTERIENRLLAINTIKSVNSPITNVFRIYNETSGEIYTLDRWNDNKIYFRYNNPPNVVQQLGERTSFHSILNEMLFVNTSLINASSLKIFKIFLQNNNLISVTEDSIASFFNTSLNFTDGNIFISEKWFNRDFSETDNINRLVSVGQYTVDYTNGVIYVAVSNTQDLNIGTVTYKKNDIAPQFTHLISTDNIYYRIGPFVPPNKTFTFSSFGEDSIITNGLDYSDELYLRNDAGAPYQVYNGNIGVFSGTFIPGVTDQVNFVRSLYEYTDLLNSTNPFNFAAGTTPNGFNIAVSGISKEVFGSVEYDGSNLFVSINENIPYISSNITYDFSIIRLSDSAQLWDGSGTIVPGNPIKLILPGINSPALNDQIKINYTFSINNLSRVVIDYNKGDLFVDYTYLADEIIISYEYGDNVIDFRTSNSIPENTQYYVSYKAGALRDALEKNFGTLVNIPELINFNVDFDRERYRDALIAALSSFIQGPTINAIKNIGKTISHVEPQITEDVFQDWSLGNSLLNPQSIKTTGSFELLPAKFDTGVLVNQDDQTITFPISSNIRLQEGTFETWVLPQWNGLDNDARLTFTITKDGYNVPPDNIFIGGGEYHPIIENNTFSVDKNSNVSGIPNTNKDGIYIYYSTDISGNFLRWYVRVIDGYVSSGSSAYKFKINSTGTFYDAKSITIPKPSNLTIFTGTNSLTFNIAADGYIDEGLTFISDLDHYLLDFGEEKSKNRLSIFKDPSGYINFRVFDKNKLSYTVSSDVSSWKENVAHHVAASWKLNTYNNRDEIHLFIDGFEVPNIIKYGQKLQPYLHEKFRTINPEEILGLSNRDILGATDLKITAGSYEVISSINFSAYSIFVGDTIYIDETGFSTTGYTITNINGQTLTLNSPMPITLVNGRFSINRTQYTITSEIDIAPNITVNTIHSILNGNDISGTSGFNQITSTSINFSTENVQPGYLIRIDNISLPTTYTILQVLGNTLVIDDDLPINIINEDFQIYDHTENELPGIRAVFPDYSISKDANFNNILTISNGVFAEDLILIRTLGINYRGIKNQYYVWGDGYQNIIKTTLPPPISLDEATITKIILPSTSIGPSNSTLILGEFFSNNISTYQPTNDVIGRTLTFTIGGTNADFSSTVDITIDGYQGLTPIIEVLSFSDYGTLDTANLYTSINFITVKAKPINVLRNAVTVISKEKYTINHSENNETVPVIKYSYQVGAGYHLFNDSPTSVRDESNLFSYYDINNYLYIQSPISAAGYYIITGLSSDRKSLFIQSTATGIPLPLPDFTDGYYQILNTTDYRSGLQNGYFTLEKELYPQQPFLLNKGFYELEYSTYAAIKFDPLKGYCYLGSNFIGQNQFNGIIDQVKIYSTMLTDTRIGESIPSNQRSITKDYNSLKPLRVDKNTLVLLNLNEFPFVNSALYYINVPTDKHHFQSSVVVNENFEESVVITTDPIVISNDGIVDSKKEGTIEFWVNHLFDTANDPNDRFYFDAFGAVLEEAVSVNNTAVKISAPASRILSVKLKVGDNQIDYFAGGRLEIDTQRAIQEESVSLTNGSVLVAKPILQVISVTIIGDLTNTDYFDNGSIGSDLKTIYLGRALPSDNLPLLITYQSLLNKNDTLNTQVIRLNRKLPNQNTKVIVSYIPKGLQGDRISLWKDEVGYVNFGISASGTDYLVRAPTRWVKGTWHRIKASYKFNGGANTDEIRLFIDGYEWTNVLFGTGLVFGESPFVMGSSNPGDGYNFVGNIIFKDPINEIFIGSQYTRESPLYALIDNFRISDLSRPIYAPYGEPLDVNYSSNIDVVLPVTQDLYTTYLLDFNSLIVLNKDFATLKNRNTGIFDFSINIFDSFDIVLSSPKVKEILEKLINILKPANSRAFITYTQ